MSGQATGLAAICAEIDALLDLHERAGSPVSVSLLVQLVLHRHEQGGPPPGPFWRGAARAQVRKMVRERVSRRGGQVVAGLDRLQRLYVLPHRRPGFVARLETMTDRDIEAKAAMHDRLASGLGQHADELREFKRARRAAKRRTNRKGGL